MNRGAEMQRSAALSLVWVTRHTVGGFRLRRILLDFCRVSLSLLCLSFLVLYGLSAAGIELADELSARDIMQRVKDRDDGDNRVSDMEMILIDKRGKQRLRKMRTFSKDFGEDDYTLMFFLTPADVKDTGFLTYDYDDDDADDDQWLYLPALKKTKRIAAGDKSGSFMGSDFNYSDMSTRSVDRYTHTLMKETEVNGHKVWQIESIPKTKEEIAETGYTKTVVFVRQDNFVVIRSVSWRKKGKRLRYMEVVSLELIDGIWVATEISMTTKKRKVTLHKTVLKTSNVKFNQQLAEADFTIRKLEKGL
jgi:hypothetical protein